LQVWIYVVPVGVEVVPEDLSTVIALRQILSQTMSISSSHGSLEFHQQP